MKRRVLITGTGLAAASFLVPPLRAADLKYDVVVAGAGLAGLSAAVAAREAGARRVLVLEKEPVVGGHSVISTGYFAAVKEDPKNPKAYREAVDLMVQDMVATGKDEGDPALIRRVAEGSGPALSWLAGMGVSWISDPYQALGGVRPRCYLSSFVRGGYDYVYALRRRLSELKGEVRFSSRLANIEKAADGSFHLTVESRGDAFSVDTRTLILATGGFGDNVELRQKYDARLTEDITTSANPHGELSPTATGDGILLAERLGAATVGMNHILTIPFSGGRTTNYVGADIYFDLSGKRFVSEDAEMEEISRAVWNLPGHTFWVMTDAVSSKGSGRDMKLLKGIVRQANSLEEAARGMKIPVETLRKTLDRYNSFARSGIDEDFGRRAFTQEIKTPPFYYGEERPYVHFCNGGLKLDVQARVISEGGKPISGLFAAGEVTGGVHGAGRLGGGSLPDCTVFGRIAGANAARLARHS